jgi:CheY-like chemotaxis protein
LTQIDEAAGSVMGDPTQIHQVVMNLCTNAYHAMLETGGRIEITLESVEVGYEETVKRAGIQMGPHLHLAVKDEGVGMDAAVLERIFEPYYTTKEPGKGTGLGLSVIHGIVKNHGGFITVESTPGRGSCFHVYLPAIEDVAEELPGQASVSGSAGRERILLVDDEEQIAAMEKQILERLGYQVTACGGSAEALSIFAARPDHFDLVITDMTMPHMTGDALAQKILAIRPDLPVILCTGYSEMITEEKAMTMGIRKFVLKPVITDELAAAVRSALESRPPRWPAVPRPAP